MKISYFIRGSKIVKKNNYNQERDSHYICKFLESREEVSLYMRV